MNWNETLRNNVTRAEELRTYMRLTSQEEEHDPDPGTLSHDSHKILYVPF